jgi:hypothetical protein
LEIDMASFSDLSLPWGDIVTKVIGNNKERKENHSTETQDFNVENPLQQREVKTTGARHQNFSISGVCLQTPWVIL